MTTDEPREASDHGGPLAASRRRGYEVTRSSETLAEGELTDAATRASALSSGLVERFPYAPQQFIGAKGLRQHLGTTRQTLEVAPVRIATREENSEPGAE